MTNQLQAAIDAAWDKRESVNAQTQGETRDAVDAALELLDSGKARVLFDSWRSHVRPGSTPDLQRQKMPSQPSSTPPRPG